MKRLANILFLLCMSWSSYAQDMADTLTVFFRKDKVAFEETYQGNGERMREFIGRVQKIQNDSLMYCILSVDYIVGSSPEGKLDFNKSLSHRRAENVTRYLKNRLAFADSSIMVSSVEENWEQVEIMLAESDIPYKEEALEIIRTVPETIEVDGKVVEERERQLIALRGGSIWWTMHRTFFPKLRYFKVIVRIGQDMPHVDPVNDVEFGEPIDISYPFAALQQDTVARMPAPELWKHELTIKTNVLGWALLGENIAVEYDFAPHFSVALPFYYSGGLDYFTSTLKFRGIVIQPEVRWYPWLPGNRNDGFYVGAHLGVGWYNYALAGDYRIQDSGGKRPSFGGGLGAGYAIKFKKHPRWGMEFALGAGVYSSKYDKLYNEPNGPYHRRGIEKIWFGIDNAAVSFTYDFEFNRKGGRR